MKKYTTLLSMILIILNISGLLPAFSQSTSKYMNQIPPGNTIRRFPPDNLQLLASNGIWTWHGVPAFSPDCKEMFFTKYLHLVDRAELWQTRLINNQWTIPRLAPFGNQAVIENCPIFSSTGDTVFFYSGRSGTGGIYQTIRQADSWSEPQKLPLTLPSGFSMGWNFSIAKNYTLYLDLYEASSGGDIYRCPLVNGSYSQFERLPGQVNTHSQDGSPFIDPYEEYLLFCSDRSGGFGSHDIYISYRNRDGGWSQPVNVGNLINSSALEVFPQVTLDGKYMFLNTVRTASQDQGYNPYWVSAAFIDLMRPIEPDTSSRVVFFSDRDGNAEIYSMFPDGSDQRRLTSNVYTDLDPSWSSDGNQVVFASDREGNQELFLMNADGSNQRRLSETGLVAGTPQWSPDRTKIVFTIFEDSYSEEGTIAIINADGSGYRAFNSAGQGCGPFWSEDGSGIIFSSQRTGHFEIYLMDSDGSNVQQVTRNQADKLHARLSPDGQQIVYTYVSPDRTAREIHLMNADGTGDVRLTQTGKLSENPGWSADGKQILFQTNRFGNHEIYRMDTDGKNQINITRNLSNDFSPILIGKPASTGIPGQADLSVANMGLGIWPNPADNQTQMEFMLKHAGAVEINLIDQLGRPVKALTCDNLPAGKHLVKMSLENLPTGIYTIIMKTGNQRGVKKLIKK